MKKSFFKKIFTHQLTLHQVNEEMQHCIQNCLDCHSICWNTITYCLQQGGMHSELDHIRLMLNCAEICQTSANFMLLGSHLHTHTCRLCVEICERMGDDAQMQACAQICRQCAESCRRCRWQQLKITLCDYCNVNRVKLLAVYNIALRSVRGLTLLFFIVHHRIVTK